MSDIPHLAAPNAASELSGVSKQRSLCSECRELNLSASEFFLPKGKGNKDPVTLYTRPWSQIRDAADCSLCQLVVFAVRAASEERLIQEALWQCQLISCILPTTHNLVAELSFNNYVPEDEVMAIMFVAQYSWTSVKLMLNKSINGCNNVIQNTREHANISIHQIQTSLGISWSLMLTLNA